MKTIYKISLGIITLCGSKSIEAQQDPMFTHYMFNTLMVNAGYAGSRDALTVTALHRSQWVDFRGAPIIQTLTLHSPLKNNHFALGMSLMNDKIGSTNKTSVYGNFAYRLNLTKESKLALGVSGGVNVYQANLSTLDLDQPNDPSFQNNINNKITPNFGFGAYYSRERFYAGLSIPKVIENKNEGSTTVLPISERRHYYFIAGALFNLTNNLAFKPTTFVKLSQAVPIQCDVTAGFIINKKATLGLMYRTGDAFGALLGYQVTDMLYLGYSYDWSYGLQTFKYNQGSHEIVLRYDFLIFEKKQIHSPRYF